MSLPLFLTRANKGRVGILAAALTSFLYLTSNHFHLLVPQYLPMGGIDVWMPFIPWTVWIYTSEYYMIPLVYWLAKDHVHVNKTLYAFISVQVVSVFIFWVWPTTYPREVYPFPDDLSGPTRFVFEMLRTGDSPANCAPSLHVSSCYVAVFVFFRKNWGRFFLFFFWTTAVAAATLTTKQHYLIDVVLGFGLAWLAHWVFHNKIRYHPRVN